MVKYIEYYK